MVFAATGDGLGRGIRRLEERLNNPFNRELWRTAGPPLRRILGEVQSGAFAEEWISENRSGGTRLQDFRKADRDHQVEVVGRRLRSMMPFMDSKEPE